MGTAFTVDRRRLKNAAYVLLASTLLAGCHLDEAVTRIDTPTSPAQLRSDFNVALPQHARNMYLASHAGGLQELERYVRFEVAPGEIEEAIRAIAKWDIAGQNDISWYEKRGIEPGKFAKPIAAVAPLPWWQLESIKNGYSYEKKTHTRMFWVDLERNIIYFFETD